MAPLRRSSEKQGALGTRRDLGAGSMLVAPAGHLAELWQFEDLCKGEDCDASHCLSQASSRSPIDPARQDGRVLAVPQPDSLCWKVGP
jgi:hypothetical protein